MANLKNIIYDHLSQDASIMVFMEDASLISFDTDASTEEIQKNKIKIKIKVDKDKDNKNIIFEYQPCSITLLSKNTPLENHVHGEALKRSLRKMEFYQPVFDASLAGDTWIDVVDFPIWDGSIFIDVSMWIPEFKPWYPRRG